ncbi:SAP domain-containing protein [Candidatus Poseidoniales archaeon]|nr:SAP domain-containing protein [Candidatus Poseidoniales archaeon]
MSEEEYSVKTVAQLKIILHEKGLPVSGKKADLIARLVENGKPTNPKSTDIVDSVQEDENSSAEDLPFFTSILENGIDSVDFDKEQTIRYAITAFMLTMIIVSLNSMSWYYYSLDYDYEEGMWGDQEQEYEIGLNEFEISMSLGGMNLLSMVMDYEGDWCGDEEIIFDCESFSTAGTITSLMLWLSMLSILCIIGMGVAQGFGKLDQDFFTKNAEMIDKILWLSATIPLLLGTLIYGLMASMSPVSDDLEDPEVGIEITSSLGGMWWMMFIFSTAYICYIYRHKIMQLYHNFMSDEPEASND